MLKHPIYQEKAVDRLSGIKDNLKTLVTVDEVLTDQDALKELKDKIVDIISIVKKITTQHLSEQFKQQKK